MYQRPNDEGLSITAMESNPVGHTVLYGQHGGRIERTVMIIFSNTEAVNAKRLQQSFLFHYFLVHDAHLVYSVHFYI